MKNTEKLMLASYFREVHRKLFMLISLTFLLLIVALYSISSGSISIPLTDIFLNWTDDGNAVYRVVIKDIRLPRVFASMVCGASLSTSGLLLQALLKNPLASPSTLGVSQGAAFGASLAIVIFGAGMMMVTCFAFGGALGATLIILALARIKNLSSEAILLSGVALSALFTSGSILIQYLATETQLAMVVFWTFGDVARSGWQEISILSFAVSAGVVYLMIIQWDMTLLLAGEDVAASLGVKVMRIRVSGMVVAALVSALATAFHGVIAFIGLIAPHMARCLAGDDYRLLIPFTAVLGAILLLSADTIGRVLMGSGALPVGVITSFLGAPMFLYLLIRGYR